MAEISNRADLREVQKEAHYPYKNFFGGGFVRVNDRIAMDGNRSHAEIANHDLKLAREEVQKALERGDADVGSFSCEMEDERLLISLFNGSLAFAFISLGEDPRRIRSIKLLQEIFPDAKVSDSLY